MMKSPFPGMDPYIEACGLWEDFHSHLIEKIGERLADAAPERYLVRTGERSYVVLVESQAKKSYALLPDVSISAARGRKKTTKRAGTAVAEAVGETEPVIMRPFIQAEHREAFVEIYEASPDQRLVTCLEVPSPSNKRPGTEGWELYLRKRQSLLLGKANLVEIDLLRGGQRLPMLDPWPDSPYALTVARAKSHLCRVWRADFRTPLPSIPVPLAIPDRKPGPQRKPQWRGPQLAGRNPRAERCRTMSSAKSVRSVLRQAGLDQPREEVTVALAAAHAQSFSAS
jgi:Protein of unknown function (DUF4058)